MSKNCLIDEVNIGVRLADFFTLHLQTERRIFASAEELIIFLLSCYLVLQTSFSI